MANKIAFCTGCDSNYFPLLEELILSVERFPQSQQIDWCFWDVGLTAEQVQWLKQYSSNIVKPDWPLPHLAEQYAHKEYIKACVNRPFLPQHFPGYETYVWLDPDTWVQDWASIEMFLAGAAKGKIALTAQVDRAYPRTLRATFLGPFPLKVKGFYVSNARKAFGWQMAQKLMRHHVLLAGMFALQADAPHWQHWQKLLKDALKKGNAFTAEQLTLGIMCHLDNYEAEILPAYTHWLCEFKPLWDEVNGQFVEPYLPHQPIGVLHMAGFDDMRIDRTLTLDFQTLEGKTIKRSYRFDHTADLPAPRKQRPSAV
ncbi:MAG: hypothetical protein GC136_06225 [Alphaproteobacteria bacterium]|nr:hypothetical protein [Alphaproteobacteria bacterium]